MPPQNSPLSEAESCSVGICSGNGIIWRDGVDSNVVAGYCECLKIPQRKKWFGERFYDIQLVDIKPRDVKQKQLKELLVSRPETSIFLSGDIRKGKTHFLAAAFIYWHKKSDRVKYYEDKTLRADLQDAELKNDLSFVYEIVKDYKHIFIDDVGKEKMSDFYRSGLYALFNEAYKNNSHLFISSNASLTELGAPEVWGKAIARRVEDLCEIVNF